MKKTWRRRNYFIKRDLQGRYIFSFFLFVLAGSFFFTVIFGLLSADTLTIVYREHNLQLGKTPVVLLRNILRAYWIFIVSGGLLVVLGAMFLTHRFAGPLFRFERTLEQMTDGNFDFEIKLRRRDEAKELAAAFNQFNRVMSERLGEMARLAERAGLHLEAARGQTGDTAVTDQDRAMEAVNQLAELLRSYKLKHDR